MTSSSSRAEPVGVLGCVIDRSLYEKLVSTSRIDMHLQYGRHLRLFCEYMTAHKMTEATLSEAGMKPPDDMTVCIFMPRLYAEFSEWVQASFQSQSRECVSIGKTVDP